MNWKQLISNKRLGQEGAHLSKRDDRTEFRRDYDRLIFSAPFRRLQNKTQVFPLPGSVFVHNRLTHSLEVASVGRSLGDDVARKLIEIHPELADSHISEIGSIVSAACLAHDMGNPPFGHSGEKAIATYFSEGPGIKYQKLLTDKEWADITHFDGNANAFRLLTHQFKGRRPGGFVLTYSTLASIVKYPFPAIEAKKQKFGYFQQEEDVYMRIAKELGLSPLTPEGGTLTNESPSACTQKVGGVRHPLVYLVEAADDICYEIMDIEDSHKLKILSFEETRDLLLGFVPKENHQRIHEHSKEVTDKNELIVYYRSCAIGNLVKDCVRVFIENEDAILAGEFEGSLIKHTCPLIRDAYKRCSEVAVSRIYNSRDVIDTELAGYKIIYTLVELFTDAVMNPDKAYSKLLLNRISSQYEVDSIEIYPRLIAVLDFISGMTDVFALDLFRKINGESLPIV